MSDENKAKEKNKTKDPEKGHTKVRKDVKAKRDESKPKEANVSSKTSSSSSSQPIASTSTSVQTIDSLVDSQQSVITVESLKYLQILDQYVSGKHWDFDVEYNLNTFSAVLWSLVITYFVFYEITDKCWEALSLLLPMSVIVSTITCIEMTVVWMVWYLSLVYHYINRNKICVTVLTNHLIIGFLNLFTAVIQFGSKTCYQWEKLDPSLEHIVPVRYDIKTTAIIHSIIAINMFICAMILAIKRNDFKFYVLWRKGLLNDYLLLDDD